MGGISTYMVMAIIFDLLEQHGLFHKEINSSLIRLTIFLLQNEVDRLFMQRKHLLFSALKKINHGLIRTKMWKLKPTAWDKNNHKYQISIVYHIQITIVYTYIVTNMIFDLLEQHLFGLSSKPTSSSGSSATK